MILSAGVHYFIFVTIIIYIVEFIFCIYSYLLLFSFVFVYSLMYLKVYEKIVGILPVTIMLEFSGLPICTLLLSETLSVSISEHFGRQVDVSVFHEIVERYFSYRSRYTAHELPSAGKVTY